MEGKVKAWGKGGGMRLLLGEEESWRMKRRERGLYGRWETLVGRPPRAREGRSDYPEGRTSPKEEVTSSESQETARHDLEGGGSSSVHVVTMSQSGSQSVAGELPSEVSRLWRGKSY